MDGKIKKFENLKNVLNDLNYDTSLFGMESMELVGKLISDLSVLREENNVWKEKVQFAQDLNVKQKQTIIPLEKDNQILLRENGALHLEMIQLQDDLDRKQEEYARNLANGRDEYKQSQFLYHQSKNQMIRMETEYNKVCNEFNSVIALLEQYKNTELNGTQVVNVILKSKRKELEMSNIINPNTKVDRSSAKSTTKSSSEKVLKHTIKSEKEDIFLNEDWKELYQDGKNMVLVTSMQKKIQFLQREYDAMKTSNQKLTSKLQTKENRYVDSNKLPESKPMVNENGATWEWLQQIDLLNDQVAKYEIQLKQALEQVKRGQKQKWDLAAKTEKLRRMKVEMDELKSELAKTQQDENVQLRKQTSNTIAPLESENKDYRIEYENAVQEIKQLNAELTNVQQQLQSHQLENDTLQQQIQQPVVQHLNHEKQTMDQLKKQIQQSDMENKHLIEKLKFIQDSKQYVDTNVPILNSNVDQLQVEKQKLSADKQKLSEDKQKLSEDKQKLSEDKQKLSEEKQKLSAEKDILAADNQKLSAEKEKLVAADKEKLVAAEKEELEMQLIRVSSERDVLLKQYEHIQEQYKNSIDQNNHLVAIQNSIGAKDYTTTLRLDTKQNAIQSVESEYKQDEIALWKDKYDQLNVQFEKVNVHAKQLEKQKQHWMNEDKIEYEQMIENEKGRSSQLMQDKCIMNQEITSLKQKITSLQESILGLKAGKEQYENELEEMNVHLKREKEQRRILENELQTNHDEDIGLKQNINILQQNSKMNEDKIRQSEQQYESVKKALKDCKMEISEKDGKLKQLGLLVQQYEHSLQDVRDELVGKVKCISKLDDRIKEMQKEIDELKNCSSSKDKELNKQFELFTQLDTVRDSMQHELDDVYESYQVLKQWKVDHEVRVLDLETSLKASQEQMKIYHHEKASTLNVNEDLKQQVYGKQKTHLELEKMYKYQSIELEQLSNDLSKMTKENQIISNECMRLHAKQDEQSQLQKQFRRSTQVLSQKVEQKNIEFNDLMTTYRMVCEEKEILQQHVDQLSNLKHKFNESNTQHTTMEQKLQQDIQDLKVKNDEYQRQIHIYREQVNQLTFELQKLSSDLQLSDSSKLILQSAIKTQEEAVKNTLREQTHLQWTNASTQEQILQMESKYKSAIAQSQALQQRELAFHTEQQKLESIILELRSSIVQLELKIDTLQQERQAMANELASTVVDSSLVESTSSGAESIREVELTSREAESIREAELTSSGEAESPNYANALNKCQQLEQKLAEQTKTVEQLKEARVKFDKFAKKYEREIKKRDEKIQQLEA